MLCISFPSFGLLSSGAGSPHTLLVFLRALIYPHGTHTHLYVSTCPYPPRRLLISYTDIFFGLNAVRVLSIVSLLLVFASSILVIVTDIEAVNAYDSANQSSTNTTSQALVDCEYIG